VLDATMMPPAPDPNDSWLVAPWALAPVSAARAEAVPTPEPAEPGGLYEEEVPAETWAG
jgi:hypothetical protein